MEKPRIMKLGFYVNPARFYQARSFQQLMPHISDSKNMYGRILLTLKGYIEKYSKVFDETQIKITEKKTRTLPNGTVTGLKKLISTGTIDIAVQPVPMYESNLKIADFSYPFQMTSATFAIRKPEYKPEVFGILKTFSWQLWIAIFSILITMPIVYLLRRLQKEIPIR